MTAMQGTLLVLVLAGAALAAIVPRIEDDYVKLDPVSDNKYNLRITGTNAEREESVELVEPGVLVVKGELTQKFMPGTLIVTYEAGPNGYVAKYTFEAREPTIIVLGLSAAALKAAAG